MKVLTKRARASHSENSLENVYKLSSYAYKGSVLAQREAQKSGIVFTIIKHGKIYKVLPCGQEVEETCNQIYDQNSFEPISIATN